MSGPVRTDHRAFKLLG